MDLLGHFLKREVGKHLVVAIDYFTRWAEVKALASITSKQVQEFFGEDVICRYGIPKVLITDNGRKFDSNTFKDFCEGLMFD